MEEATKGAWIVHHGKKIQGSADAVAEFSAIDLAAKSAGLLARMAASDEQVLSSDVVNTLAKVGGLNPRIELQPCLTELVKQRVIDISKGGEVNVLGITSNVALTYAARIFDQQSPESSEQAVLELGEISSKSPVNSCSAVEYISDIMKIPANETRSLINDSCSIGFVDSEGDGPEKIIFNGNLFRRDRIEKTAKILSSLTDQEVSKFNYFEENLRKNGAVEARLAEQDLGSDLLNKLRAAAVFDENVVSNEQGDFSFITSPGAFNKFSNPMEDDAFDHAKMLVSALSYGINNSSSTRGQIWGVDLLLKKLINGLPVGPAPAIGNDYKALELEGVLKLTQERYGRFSMTLLKREIGSIALAVLEGRDGSSAALAELPAAGFGSYTSPEQSRVKYRNRQKTRSKRQMYSMLESVRSQGGI